MLLLPRYSPLLLPRRLGCSLLLHTNADLFNQEDPYKRLGLTWGATNEEVKTAYRKLARIHHPDIAGYVDAKNLQRFHDIKAAYDSILKGTSFNSGEDEAGKQFSFSVWRKADSISQKRQDVAGAKRVRPAPPVGRHTSLALDFANSVPVASRRGGRSDIIGAGDSAPPASSTLGSGKSKWVRPKIYEAWKPKA
jgi:hypothetical protein